MIGSVSLKGIRAFEAVARLGSFRAAATEMKLTSSAVSHAVIDLERDLGIGLIDRQKRGGRLTERGEAFYAHVRIAFDQLRLGLDEASQRMRRMFRLHAAPTFAAGWLSPRLPRFLALHPEIEVRLSAGTDYSSFSNNDFDADIVYGPVRATNVTIVPIIEETIAPMCAPSIAALITTPADLRRQVLIQSETKMVRWSHWFEKNGEPSPNIHGIRFDRSFLAIAAAADGLGVALESTLLAERELASGRLVMPLAGRAKDITYVGHSLVFPKLAKPNKLVGVFAEWLKQEIGDSKMTTAE
ncbi:MAG TPA: LysR substrate-binding domain-containing protein [Hyphomicrobiaceae bacterium]|nr:LysR substrate-binding domain-containing protein [Hyphomicrobiaceae bacterium]